MARPRRGKITDRDLERVMALADPSRWALMRLLAAGPRSMGELARSLSLSLPVVSRHLQRLRRAGLVLAARDGRNLRCALPGADTEAGRWLAAVGARPGARMAAARAAGTGAAAAKPTRRRAPSERPVARDADRGEAQPARAAQTRLPGRDLDDFLL